MGFFSKLKTAARQQISPVMPMAPQPMPRPPVMPQRPRMPEALPPRRDPMNRGIPGLMNQMEGEPRMMMAFGGPSQMTQGSQHMMPDGRQMPGANHAEYEANMQRPGYANGNEVNDGGMVDFLNSDPRQKLFGIENRIEMLLNQKQEAEANRDRESFDMIVQEINDADAQRIEIMNSMKPNPTTQDFQQRGFDKTFRALLKGGVKGRDDSELAEQQKLQNLEMQMEQQKAIDDMLSRLEKKN